MEIRKVKNDGKHLKENNIPVSFITENGFVIPDEIWAGKAKNGIEVVQITQEECVAEVERVNKIINVTERLKMHGKTN